MRIGVRLDGMRTAGVALLSILSLLFASALASGCADKTSLIVEVASPDLTVPTDVDTLRFEALTPDGWRILEAPGDASIDAEGRVSISIGEPWPHSLAILPGAASASSMVLVSVTGLSRGDFAVRRTVQTRFMPGQTNRVVVQLTRACLGVECEPGIDCVAGLCTNVIIPDAGMDSSMMDSSTMDSSMVDSSTMDSSMMDTGTMDTSTDGGCATGPEVCGGGDEDCDTFIDEGLPCSGSLVLSEVATGGPAGGFDEFVEIYNTTDFPIDIGGLETEYLPSGATTWRNQALLPSGAMIPARGFYLVGGSAYSRGVAADPGGGWGSGMSRLGGHVRLLIGVTELDRLGWGTAVSPEGTAVPTVVDDGVNTFERKAVPTSSVASMTTGADRTRGNGHDTDDNRLDFVERGAADPQNTASPTETP